MRVSIVELEASHAELRASHAKLRVSIAELDESHAELRRTVDDHSERFKQIELNDLLDRFRLEVHPSTSILYDDYIASMDLTRHPCADRFSNYGITKNDLECTRFKLSSGKESMQQKLSKQAHCSAKATLPESITRLVQNEERDAIEKIFKFMYNEDPNVVLVQ